MKVLGDLQNLTIDRGSTFPSAQEGEIFILCDHATLANGIYHYENGAWLLVGSSAVIEFASVGKVNGTNVTSYVNASRSIHPVSAIISSTTIPANTTPSNTTGTEIWTADYQLNNAANELFVTFTLQIKVGGPKTSEKELGVGVLLYKDGTPIGGVVKISAKVDTTVAFPITSMLRFEPGDALNHTYSLRAGLIDSFDTKNQYWAIANVDDVSWGTTLDNSSFIVIEEST